MVSGDSEPATARRSRSGANASPAINHAATLHATTATALAITNTRSSAAIAASKLRSSVAIRSTRSPPARRASNRADLRFLPEKALNPAPDRADSAGAPARAKAGAGRTVEASTVPSDAYRVAATRSSASAGELFPTRRTSRSSVMDPVLPPISAATASAPATRRESKKPVDRRVAEVQNDPAEQDLDDERHRRHVQRDLQPQRQSRGWPGAGCQRHHHVTSGGPSR
jgi:hypothetical protein